MRVGDFSLHGVSAYAAWSPRLCERAIAATGVRGDGLTPRSGVLAVSPTVLRGCGAEVAGDDLPVVAVQTGGGKVQHDAPHRRLDPGTELAEVFAQGADLGAAEGRARGVQAQLLVEHLGGGGQQAAQLIGEETAASRPPCIGRRPRPVMSRRLLPCHACSALQPVGPSAAA